MGLKNKRILITCGPTWVAIDPVRVISNCSTGALGHILAEELIKAGARVTLLEGPVTHSRENRGVRIRKFLYFDELASQLKHELKSSFAAVIHAAAVSDYQLKKKFSTKLSSSKKNLTLCLVPTKKLITLIKHLAPKTFLVGFKLETSTLEMARRKQVEKLFQSADCDLVVANTLGRHGYQAAIIDKRFDTLAQANSRKELARKLTHLLKEKL
jgi:phosphopantothenoylcysteine synthetase/decarboxylase